MNDAIALEFVIDEGMTIPGAEAETEVLEDLACTPRLSLRVDRLQREGGLLFVLTPSDDGKEDDEAQGERYEVAELQLVACKRSKFNEFRIQ